MAGIYIHIPFCRHKCSYCNFYSLASTKHMDQIGQAISVELAQRKHYLQGLQTETIYFGGGTPSLFKSEETESILEIIRANYAVAADAEITLEANPDDLSPAKLESLKKAGVNRLSIGIQSFREEDLKYLGRTHSSAQVLQCIEDAKSAGFSNLSIDLIYGIPTLTPEGWTENLGKAFELEIPHISAYSLTVEERTSLQTMIRRGTMLPIDETSALTHYQILVDRMQQQDYEQYEVSNFCIPGLYSRHNTAYWQGKHYLGVGPSAHSYNSFTRSWNIANLSKYIESVALGKVETEQEFLSPVTRLNEYIMTSLRTMWGCDLQTVKSGFGELNAKLLLNNSLQFIEAGQMENKAGKLILTPKGLLFADGIASALFGEEE